MNHRVESNGFLFSRLIVNGKTVPILVRCGKLVAFPSRFALYSIEKKNMCYSKMRRHLKVLAKFLNHLHRQDKSGVTIPDTLLLSATDNEVEQFLKLGWNRTNGPKRSLLLSDFFTWLEREEGVKTKVTFKFPNC
jgi:hypothetical protein